MARTTLHPVGSEPIEGSLQQRPSADGSASLTWTTGGETFATQHEELGAHQGLLRTEQGLVPYFWCRTGSELHLWVDGDTYVFELHNSDGESATHRTAGGATGDVTAPMPGVIRKVLVSVGDAVEAAASVLVMESMKMQLSLPAPGAGTVTEVLCEEGQMVDMGATLLRLASPEPPALTP